MEDESWGNDAVVQAQAMSMVPLVSVLEGAVRFVSFLKSLLAVGWTEPQDVGVR